MDFTKIYQGVVASEKLKILFNLRLDCLVAKL